MVFLPDLPRNRTLLITGVALLVLAVCSLAGAFGVDTHGMGARVAYGVVGVVLLLAGVGVLVLQKAPQTMPLGVSSQGLLIPTGGGTGASLPWTSVSRVRIERGPRGQQLVAELRPGAPVPPQLQALMQPQAGAVVTRLVIGLGAASPDRLAAELGAVAPPGVF